MNTNKILLITLVTISLLTDCCTENSSQSSRDENIVTKEERKFVNFNGIDLKFSAEVVISQGIEQKVVVEGAVSDLKNVVTELEGSRLVLQKKLGTWHMGKIIVFITIEHINDLSIGGSGTIVNNTPLTALNLKLDVTGSGFIQLSDIKTDTISSTVSGSGSINLIGKDSVYSQNIDISGSGSVLVHHIKTSEINVNINGSGICKVFATKKLSIDLTGSGLVLYAGKPVLTIHSTGSGKVREIHN